ncbi:MAG: hypothetical protein D6679_00095 [Candidatus Hydrogenedentota bacterium]|nr:MAG: hypothetical protein D6679_00095 [Candidatus Hydrogenedentota bacterium]
MVLRKRPGRRRCKKAKGIRKDVIFFLHLWSIPLGVLSVGPLIKRERVETPNEERRNGFRTAGVPCFLLLPFSPRVFRLFRRHSAFSRYEIGGWNS